MTQGMLAGRARWGWAPEITWKAQLVPSAGLAVTGSGAAY